MRKRLRKAPAPRLRSTLLYQIDDSHGVSSLIEAHVVTRPGEQAEAAQKLGVSQSVLSRLRHGQLKSIRASTLQAIERHLPTSELREQLHNSVQSPEIRASLRRYEAWLESSLAAYRSGRSRACWSNTNTADLLAMLEEHDDYRHHFSEFAEAVRRRWGDSPETERRIELSKHRALAALVQVEPSGGIERQAGELHENGDLAPYLKAALTAERRLLNRRPALERLRRVRAEASIAVEWRASKNHP